MPEAPTFEELRPRAFAVAYRMLGSVTEAEDIVQEAMLRLHLARQAASRSSGRTPSVHRGHAAVHRPAAIGGVRRERYVGEWLPEPLVDDGRSDPVDNAELADSLSLAFLVLLETLSPEQRAAFVLREVFDYPYTDIAAIIGTGEDNARQLVARARRHVDERRPRFEASHERREQLARRFLAAVSTGDLHALEELLTHDVVLHGDGGGQVRAITHPVHGRARVARALLSWMRAAEPIGGWSLRQVQVNGQPGAMVFDAADVLVAVAVLDIADDHVQAVHSIVNPDKLRHLDRRATR